MVDQNARHVSDDGMGRRDVRKGSSEWFVRWKKATAGQRPSARSINREEGRRICIGVQRSRKATGKVDISGWRSSDDRPLSD